MTGLHRNINMNYHNNNNNGCWISWFIWRFCTGMSVFVSFLCFVDDDWSFVFSIIAFSQSGSLVSIHQRIPVSIVTLNRANILMLNLKATLEVHLVSLDQSSLWVLNRPDHTSNDKRSHLKSISILIGSSFTRRFDIKLRVIPVSILWMAKEKYP